jgi:hypothetical protein
MLQWTCRLRDAIESNPCLAGNDQTIDLSLMKEAELVYPCCDESSDFVFPSELLSMEFANAFLRQKQVAIKYEPGYFTVQRSCFPVDPLSESIRAKAGQRITDLTQERIDVLWLSPRVFMSSIEFHFELDGGMVCLGSYSVEFHRQTPRGHLFFESYTLDIFENASVETFQAALLGQIERVTSVLPLNLLRQMTPLLPENYFSEISLARVAREFPLLFFRRFLDCIPYPAAARTPPRKSVCAEECFKVTFPFQLTRFELQEMASYRFHPSVRAEFDVFGAFAPSVPLNVANDLFRECSYLKSVSVPRELAVFEGTGASFAAAGRFDYMELEASDRDIRLSLLNDISENHCLKEFRISSEFVPGDAQRHHAKLRHLFHCVTRGCGSLKKFSVTFITPTVGLLRKEFKSAEIFQAGPFYNLCVFCATLEKPFPFGCIESGMQPDRLDWFEDRVAPSLLLNYYREYFTPVLKVEIIPSAVRSINGGVVYHKTTNVVPFDMSIANAGLIFRIVRDGLLG